MIGDIIRRIPLPLLSVALVVAVFIVLFQMVRGTAIVCADGAILAKTCDGPQEPFALPGPMTDAVVAFVTDSCPEGWVDFVEARGRFIVGAGRHSEHDRYAA